MSDANVKNKLSSNESNKASSKSSNDVRLGDGVMTVAKTEANKRAQEFVSIGINMFFDFLENKVKDIPEAIKRLRNNPETDKEFAAFWSEQLYKKGLISENEIGLVDEYLINNIRQQVYSEGMLAGALITMKTLEENGTSKEELLAARGQIVHKILEESYDDMERLVKDLEGEVKQWTKELSSDDEE